MAQLDAYDSTESSFAAEDSWKEGSVTLWIPNAKFKYFLESEAPEFIVLGFYYCSLLEVLKNVCLSPDAQEYYWVPLRLFHKSQEAHIHIYSEIYNSDAMLEEDTKI